MHLDGCSDTFVCRQKSIALIKNDFFQKNWNKIIYNLFIAIFWLMLVYLCTKGTTLTAVTVKQFSVFVS